ncbi:sigma-54-dependent transcriptional regulator [endosymbiont of Lamellibrachia barhami]|uniref:sigma-54-dependent transcriptional regulator n=1 Tax=endosymbiont of Lamellibrachia barhami TaxID=205975 RepID=UPI0015B31143|nr:sigma-54 dependent transcriptional regulator [endosymbiont of Lamellibrachia barhami]
MVHESNTSFPVVLVDDEATVLFSTQMILGSAGIKEVLTVKDSRELMPLLAGQEVAAVVLDLFMPYLSGTQLLPEIVREHPELPVIVMTAAQEVETAVACMKEGAFDYLVKPVEESRFVSSIKRALEMRTLRRQVSVLKRSLMTDELEHGELFSNIVTVSRKMRSLFQYLEAIASSGEPVLINGETGSGKELLAEAIHRLSGRTGAFVPVNVAGLDDALFSDTLFGHRKGAFSGADTTREGMIAQAEGGTLFLDEIGDLTLASQVKLLRLLQERHYYPLGSDMAKMSSARILCATHRDLNARMAEESFRSDLYYRLSVHQVDIPPLRERKEDIPVLLAVFAAEAADSLGKKLPEAPPELLTLLTNYHFPGNVRELRSMVFDAVARHKSGRVLAVKSFRKTIKTQQVTAVPSKKKAAEKTDSQGRFQTLKEAEQLHIEEALHRAAGNQGTAAALLGISRPALNRRLARMRDD